MSGAPAIKPLLRSEKCTIRFGGLTAVSELDLHIGAGELVGLIGPNGAGKTT
ncbi:MAG TPA: ATP-binding cassette domain-containing protein, partial [Candidatus Dormibacteraeota bacterium]|nr:ATP-binding cassette domain-containing protein [Candidatus Dormibacteraeota bacterium]